MSLTAIKSGYPDKFLFFIFVGLPILRILLFAGVGLHLLYGLVNHLTQVFSGAGPPPLELSPVEESQLAKAFYLKYVLLVVSIGSILSVLGAASKNLNIGLKLYRDERVFYLGMKGYPYIYVLCSALTIGLQSSPYFLPLIAKAVVDTEMILICVTPITAIWEMVPYNFHDELLESIGIYSGLMNRFIDSTLLLMKEEEEERNRIKDEYDACLPYCRSHPPLDYPKRFMTDKYVTDPV